VSKLFNCGFNKEVVNFCCCCNDVSILCATADEVLDVVKAVKNVFILPPAATVVVVVVEVE
jgi:hypothetical protein